jgi:hypothetical protein
VLDCLLVGSLGASIGTVCTVLLGQSGGLRINLVCPVWNVDTTESVSGRHRDQATIRRAIEIYCLDGAGLVIARELNVNRIGSRGA